RKPLDPGVLRGEHPRVLRKTAPRDPRSRLDLALHRRLLLLRHDPLLARRHADDGDGQAALPDRAASPPTRGIAGVRSAAAWVVGSGGQLGSAVARLLPERLRDTRLWAPGPRRFSWNDPSSLLSEFALATAAYGREVAA